MEILGSSLADSRDRRTSIKWREYPLDVLPVWVAEMDAAPCGPVVEAVSAALRRGDTGYAWTPPFVEAFCAYAEATWSWTVEPQSVFPTPDVMGGIEQLLHVATVPNSAVVVSPPCYNAFFGFIESVGRRLVEAPLGADFRLDESALDRAFREAGAGSAYILCNPQNPTGTVHTRSELALVARLAAQHGVLVISDEIHAQLVYPGSTFTPYLTVPGSTSGIAMVTPSKAFNLCGLKAALMVAGDEARPLLGRLHEVVTHGVNHLGVIAQTTAYTQGQEWLDQVVAELAGRRKLLERLVPQRLPGASVAPGEASFLAWLDLSALGLDDPVGRLLERGRVALSPGPSFDARARQRARFNFGTSVAVIDEAVRRMASAVAP